MISVLVWPRDVFVAWVEMTQGNARWRIFHTRNGVPYMKWVVSKIVVSASWYDVDVYDVDAVVSSYWLFPPQFHLRDIHSYSNAPPDSHNEAHNPHQIYAPKLPSFNCANMKFDDKNNNIHRQGWWILSPMCHDRDCHPRMSSKVVVNTNKNNKHNRKAPLQVEWRECYVFFGQSQHWRWGV